MRQLETRERARSGDSLERSREREPHSSMRDMEPLPIPDDGDDDERPSGAGGTPRRRPSRIPLHTAHKGAAPRPPRDAAPAPATPSGSVPPRPPSAHSVRSVRSAASGRSRASRDASVSAPTPRKDGKSAVPVRRPSAAHDAKVRSRSFWNTWFFKDS